MNNCTLAVLLFCFSFASISSNAQKKIPSCGWFLPPADESSLLKRATAEQKLQVQTRFDELMDNDELYVLPIVVHVVHTGTPIGSPDNPSDANIHAMIQQLNNSWRKNGPNFGGVDMRMQFQLAVRSPNCAISTGINRVNGSAVSNYASGGIGINGFPGSADEALVKNLSRWPNTDYINIWIVNKINGTDVGIGGYAYFAQHSDAGIDGIVMNAQFVNGSNRTIAHEMGHVFELYHTFYDDAFETNCPRTDSCSFYGDRVCDTEPSVVAFNCFSLHNSCSGGIYTVADPNMGYTVLNNHMNFTDCPWMFTAGQKARVRAALKTFRPGLINSGALTAAPGNAPLAACMPFVSNGQSPFYGVERVEFNSIRVYSNTSMGDRSNYIDRSCNQRTTVYKGQSYQLKIEGSYENPHSFKAFLDYNNDGDFNDPNEQLLSGYSSSLIAQVTVPENGVVTGIPLRMRVIADNPAPGNPTMPTACQINGTAIEGSGQVEDYAVIIVPGNSIQSVTSGAWNNPSTWNCNCIPVPGDIITVKNGHSISVTQAMGLIEFSKLIIETGASVNIGSNAQFRQRK